MHKLINNRRGSAEIIALLLILPLILFPLWSGFYMFEDIYRYDIIKQAARQALLRMESRGGLTTADYDNLVLYLTEKGLNEEDLTIDYTPFPINYGDDVVISISYNYTKTRISMNILALERIEEAGVMVCGPLKSTSKHYER